MSNVAENITTKANKAKIPLWFIILFSTILLFTLSSFGLYAYQKKNKLTINLTEESQQYIQKLNILQQDDVIDTNWLHTLNPLVKKVQGRLLWSSKKQQGVMEFINLPKLNHNQHYQLWIYDLYANNTKPIAAIVDDSIIYKKTNKKIIPFKAGLLVNSPFKFEITLEEIGVKEGQPLLLAQP